MADYLINPLTGSDVNDATTSPARTLARVEAESPGSSDTVTISGTSLSAPIRGVIASGTTYKGAPCITTALNVSEGATHTIADHTTQFQASTGWALQNAAVNTTDVLIGTNSLEMTTGGQSYARRTFNFNSAPFRFRVINKNVSGSSFSMRIYNTSTTEWLNIPTGEWGTGSAGAFYAISSDTDWNEAITDWFVGETVGTHYRVDLAETGNTGTFLNQVIVEEQTNWTVYSEDVYQTPLFLLGTPSTVWKSRGINSSFEDLELSIVGTDEDSLNAGEWYYDATARLLFYRLEAGEDITDMHIEINDIASVVNPSTTGMVLDDGLTAMASAYPFLANTGGSFVAHRPYSLLAISNGFGGQGSGVAVLHSPKVRKVLGESSGVTHGEGIFTQDTSSITAYGVDVSGCSDDGLQCRDGSTLLVEGGVVQDCAGNPFECFSNFSGTYSLKGITLSQRSDTVQVLVDQSDNAGSDRTIKGCITTQQGAGPNVAMTDSSAGTVDFSDNFHDSGTMEAGYGASSTQTNELFTDYTSFELTATSPAVGAGVAMSNLAIGGNGRPYPAIDIDAGGNPSTHGPFHPRNL